MNRKILLAALLVVGTVFLRGDGCIMKNKVVEIVVKSETSADFQAVGVSEVFSKEEIVVLDAEIDDALKNAGYSRDDIKKAVVMAGHYGTTANNTSHDWTISGSVKVARDLGSPSDLMLYQSQSVDAALDKKIPAPLEATGVDVLNQAIADYLSGGSLITLTFSINNGSCTPSPSVADPVNFNWRAWVTIHVILEDDVDVPDPF